MSQTLVYDTKGHIKKQHPGENVQDLLKLHLPERVEREFFQNQSSLISYLAPWMMTLIPG